MKVTLNGPLGTQNLTDDNVDLDSLNCIDIIEVAYALSVLKIRRSN